MKQLLNPSRIACLFAAVLISMAALLSCSQYDDTELRNSLTDLEERIADLEEAVRAEQDNINALNELINRIESGLTVDGIEETADGYDIILSNGERISISNGEPGTATEALSLIVKEEDGVWYWAYSDGTFVTIDGERIPVTTEAPQVRINEKTGNWEINNGDGWKDTGIRAEARDGEDGESFLEGIEEDDDYYYITLKGGNVVTLPKTTELSFRFESDADTVYFNAGDTKEISYTMTGNVTVMTVNKPDGWRTTVDEENSVMSITAPAEDNLFAETTGVISVVLTDAQGKNFAALLNVAIKILDPEINIITTSLIVPAEGGECRIDYEIINPVKGGQISAGTESTWLSDFRCSDEGVTFTAASNDKSVRATYVIISYSYNDKVIETSVSVTQEAPTSGYYYDNIMTRFSGSYFGEFGNNPGEYNWTCRIYTDKYEYYFDFYGSEPEKGSELPPAGQYVLSEPGMTDVMTFSVDNSYFYNISIDYYLEFMSGTLDISYEGDNIIIDAKLMDEDEYTHHAVYKGPAEF